MRVGRIAMRASMILIATPSFLAAQGSVIVRAPLDSGTLIRMTPQGGQPIEGRLLITVPAAGTMLTYCRYPGAPCLDPSDTTPVRHATTSSLTRLEVQRGDHGAKTAAIAGTIALALGFAGKAAVDGACEFSCHRVSPAIPFAFAGFWAGLGWLFGSASPEWGLQN